MPGPAANMNGVANGAPAAGAFGSTQDLQQPESLKAAAAAKVGGWVAECGAGLLECAHDMSR